MNISRTVEKNFWTLPGTGTEALGLETAAGAAPTGGGLQTLKGQWKALDSKYQLALSGGGRDEVLMATLEGDRLTIGMEGFDLAFDRED